MSLVAVFLANIVHTTTVCHWLLYFWRILCILPLCVVGCWVFGEYCAYYHCVSLVAVFLANIVHNTTVCHLVAVFLANIVHNTTVCHWLLCIGRILCIMPLCVIGCCVVVVLFFLRILCIIPLCVIGCCVFGEYCA